MKFSSMKSSTAHAVECLNSALHPCGLNGTLQGSGVSEQCSAVWSVEYLNSALQSTEWSVWIVPCRFVCGVECNTVYCISAWYHIALHCILLHCIALRWSVWTNSLGGAAAAPCIHLLALYCIPWQVSSSSLVIIIIIYHHWHTIIIIITIYFHCTIGALKEYHKKQSYPTKHHWHKQISNRRWIFRSQGPLASNS